MKIVVLSGKGGTGKSTVTANLAYAISMKRPIVAVDCDVEEPNLHLFFSGSTQSEEVQVLVPAIDSSKCTLCGDCARFCRYGALVMGLDRPMLYPQMCHSCGGCALVCKEKAIREVGRTIGRVDVTETSPSLRLITGILQEGEVQAPPVIHQAKELSAGAPLVLLDSSPGIACPVIETLEGADLGILVTESTPFGLHDMKLAADVASEMGVRSGVIINRSDGQDELIREFCEEAGLPILMTIPFDRDIASIQNQGGLICKESDYWQQQFIGLYERLLKMQGEVQ